MFILQFGSSSQYHDVVRDNNSGTLCRDASLADWPTPAKAAFPGPVTSFRTGSLGQTRKVILAGIH